MWADFSGKAYSREQFAARIDSLKWNGWKPVGIVLHNTAAPTLAQWVESGPAHDARIKNLQAYYEGMGWHGGPHWFISRNWLNEFSNPLRRGTHSPSFNATHFGIEMVGDYDKEPFSWGEGALVRDNAVFAMAVLCRKFGWDIAKVLKLHKEDPKTTHDCPGKLVSKADVIERVHAEMARLGETGTGGAGGPAGPTGTGGAAVPPSSSTTIPVVVTSPAIVRKFTGITATVFGGDGEVERSAYDSHRIGEHEYAVALPARFSGVRPKVKVTNPKNGKSVVCSIEDVGPWNGKSEALSDRYWNKPQGTRPQAESGRDLNGRKTNRAGIDLSPAAARAIGIDGMGKVDWEFV